MDPDSYYKSRIRMERYKLIFNLDFFLHFYNVLLIFKINLLSYIRYKQKYLVVVGKPKFWRKLLNPDPYGDSLESPVARQGTCLICFKILTI